MIRYIFNLAIFILLFVENVSCATTGNATNENFSKNAWVVSGAFCPVGCPKDILEFINSQIGKSINLSSDEFSVPFLDHCDGVIHYDFRKSNVDDIANDINKGISNKNKIVKNDLKISGENVLNAIVYCKTDSVDLPVMRILAIESNRILILFEEQSLIELH